MDMVRKNKKTLMRTFVLNDNTFDLTQKAEIENLHHILTPKFINAIENTTKLPEIMDKTSSDILPCKVGAFYINKNFYEYVDIHYKWNTVGDMNMLIKCAIYDKIVSDPHQTNLHQYLYGTDSKKCLQARSEYTDVNQNTIDAISRFHCRISNFPQGGIGYRLGYTKDGNRFLSKKRYDDNIKLLRYIFNGDENKVFVCASTGKPLENIGYKGFPDELRINTSIIPFHHVLLVDGKSVTKYKTRKMVNSTTEPIKVLHRKDLSVEKNKLYLIDIMSCLPMTTHQHQCCHKLPYSDITMHTQLAFVPLHMQSKKHFNKVSKKYNLELSYEDFMHSLKFESLGLDRDKIIDEMKTLVANTIFDDA